MSTKARFLKGAMQVGLGQVGQQLLLFGRNIVVARLLPPEQFGIALTLVTVISALDAVSELGVELFLIRSPKASETSLQSTLHTILIARGFVAAAAIVLLAAPIANLFGVPEVAQAYRWLALVPAIRGFMHLDVRRFEKEFRYWPGIIANFMAIGAGTLAAAVLVILTRSYWAMLLAYIVQYLVLVGAYHYFAERRYELSYQPAHVRDLMRYGGPLLLNGILLFGLAQGDRLFIGSALSVTELAHYGVVSVLTTGLTSVVMRMTGALYLPLLSAFEVRSDGYARRYEVCGAITTLLALATATGFSILGDWIVLVAFGPQYRAAPLLVTSLSLQAAFRMLRSWPQISFLSSASTQYLLYGNLASAAGVIASGVVAANGLGIEYVGLMVAAGEVLAAVLTFAFFVPPASREGEAGLRFLACLLLVAAALLTAAWWELWPESLLWRISILTAVLAGCVTCVMSVASQARAMIFDVIRRRTLSAP